MPTKANHPRGKQQHFRSSEYGHVPAQCARAPQLRVGASPDSRLCVRYTDHQRTHELLYLTDQRSSQKTALLRQACSGVASIRHTDTQNSTTSSTLRRATLGDLV